MPIVTTSKDIPPHLREPFSTRSGFGQLRSGQQIAHFRTYYGTDWNGEVCISIREGDSLSRYAGTFVEAHDMYKEDEDEHGNEVFVLLRSVIYLEGPARPVVIDWTEVREAVVEVGSGSEF